MLNLLIKILAEAPAGSAGPAEQWSLSDVEPRVFLWLGLIVIAAFFMLRSTRRRIVRSRQLQRMPLEQRIEARNPSAQIRVYSDQLEELMVALAEMSRQINGQIDTRTAKLEILIQQAEDTIDKLQQVQNQSEKPAKKKSSAKSKSPASKSKLRTNNRLKEKSDSAKKSSASRLAAKGKAKKTAAKTGEPKAESKNNAAVIGESISSIQHKTDDFMRQFESLAGHPVRKNLKDSGGPEDSGVNDRSEVRTDSAGDQRERAAAPMTPEHNEVLQLHKQGLDKIAIAHQLNRPVGEVELILSLHKSQF